MISIEKKARTFISEELEITSWNAIEKYFEDLKGRNIESLNDFKKFLQDRSELETALQEDLAWRYIRMTCDTTNEEYEKAFNFFVGEIEPQIAPYSQELNLKFLNSPFLSQLNDDSYANLIRQTKQQVEIYREENVQLLSELHQKEQTYGSIAGAMTVMIDEKELTLQQAANFLKSNDRNKREEVFYKISERRLIDKEKLDDLYSELIQLRNKIAVNAGFENYRDYAFASMGRFDYTPEDCFKFHDAISKAILPICGDFNLQRKNALHLETLKPWDLDVDIDGNTPLKPFTNGDEMMDKAIACFYKVNPLFGECMEQLKNKKRIDLDSRIGKAPGGYNYPLYETGVPFIFMNSTGMLRDLVTIVHEGGHAIHSVLTHDLQHVDFKSTPSEVAELASMGMELISMEHWQEFFADATELKRAKLQHLEDVIKILPWIATVDKFQHWIYTNANHTLEERKNKWEELTKEFGSNIIDWSGLEYIRNYSWQKQLHIFEVPFYYIEYGMAQLGAVALWRNYKTNPQQTVEQYINALKLGYTKTIGEIYKTAGVRFDFSADYIKELCNFVSDELQKLKQ